LAATQCCFLRARNLGFAAAIEGILADLRTREDLPWSLLNIVGEESPISQVENGDWAREQPFTQMGMCC